MTIFLIVEIPMALYIIMQSTLAFFESDFMSQHLKFAVHLLNFAVLLSYPINFFIYCRMSRVFRDAFKALVCPPFLRIRSQHLQSFATSLIPKKSGAVTNTERLEFNDAYAEMKTLNNKKLLSLSFGKSNVISNKTDKDIIEFTNSCE